MGPKKNISTRQISMSLDETIETNEWHCAVGIVIEKEPKDYSIVSQFPTAAFRGLRQEIRSINYDLDIIRIIKQFMNGEIEYRYSSLLTYSSVFEEAAEIVKKNEKLPVPVLVQIVRALILLLKREDIERTERKRTNPNDPIKAMADRPFMLNGGKAKKGAETKADKKEDKSLKLKPPSVGKEDTKLLKRGEGSKESELIDDGPKNSFYQLYVVLTGFYDPDLPLELLKAHIPLTTVICLDSPLTDSFSRNSYVEHFWEKFLKIIWSPLNIVYFKDTIFQVYAPENLPTALNDLEKFIYTEISFLMYDLSDLKRQHTNYLDTLQLWDVSEGENKIQHEPEYQEELDSLPCEFVTIPVVLQYILDALCGEDDIREEGALNINYASLESEAPSIYTRKTNLSSITTLPDSPNLSQVFMGDVRNPIYQKFKSLDVKYDLTDEKFYEHLEDKSISSDDASLSILIKRQRLYAENLEDALRGGVKQNFITSCWKNRELPCHDCKYKEIKFPPIIMDYSLYLLWMQKMTCPYENEKNEVNNVVKDTYGHRYTITEFTRMEYNKNKGYFSAPELKIISPDTLKSTSKIKIQPFISDLNIPEKYLNDEMKVYEDIRTFLGEDIFSNSNGFEFVQEFSKKEMEDLIEEVVLDYNCVDCFHSALTDSVFLICHKRKGDDGAQREAYNVSLKTAVGLRDFYDFVIDDEKDWINENEECYKKISGKSETSVTLPVVEIRNFTDADFVLENSLKSQKILEDSLKSANESRKVSLAVEEEEVIQCVTRKTFNGYDVSPVAVQYSGLNTFFSAADNCSVEVELQERLYGKQELKLKIRQGGHILYLYSYVCPKPHIFDPYTCHIIHKSGIIIAFSRRTIETFEEIEELVPIAPVKSKSKKLSEEKSQVVIRKVSVTKKDENFFYDMKLSLPSGLTVETVRNIVEPCYIKQGYIVRPDCYSKSVQNERNRLFLPNGDLIKMLTDNTVEVLRGDATIINSLLEPKIGACCSKTLPNGDFFRIIDDELDFMKRFQILENLDMETNVSYFRRGDGTNYALYPDGMFCVYFKDGTKISTSFNDESEIELTDDDENYGGEYSSDSCSFGSDQSDTFVLVHVKRIFEHPDYASVIYDTSTNEWTIKLPFDSEIKITTNGSYSVRLDEFTDFNIDPEIVFMNRRVMETFVETFADLSVFDKDEKKYCETIDSSGKNFVVESTGNCYVNDDTDLKEESDTERMMSNENRYFVIRPDKSGFELLHKDNAFKMLSCLKGDTILFSKNLPGPENKRFFVLLDPYIKRKKWEVKSTIPDFEYSPNNPRKQITSTYGVPPSWMHPFYEKKAKIRIPDRLTARVLIELKKTDFQRIHDPKFKDCLVDQERIDEVKFENGFKSVQKVMRKIAANDQNLLRDLYISAVSSEIQIASSSRPIDSEKLKHYLEMSEYYNQMKEFYKDSIKNHIIPNYFTHPAGLSWLILQDLIDSVEETGEESTKISTPEQKESAVEVISSETVYNLVFSPEKTFSELSYRTNVSSRSAPTILERFKSSVCEGKDTSKSEPAMKYESFTVGREVVVEKKSSVFSKRGSGDLKKEPSNSCVFTVEDIKLLSNSDEFSRL